MSMAPNKPGSTIQSFFLIQPLERTIVHDARLTIAEHSTCVKDARALMSALGVGPREIGILTR